MREQVNEKDKDGDGMVGGNTKPYPQSSCLGLMKKSNEFNAKKVK